MLEQSSSGINVNEQERVISFGLGTALALFGLRKGFWPLAATALGGYLVYRGLSGSCKLYEVMKIDTSQRFSGAGRVVSAPLDTGVEIEHRVTVNRSPAEVYLFWRNLENLPRFMKHLRSVKTYGDGRSHWVALAPGGLPIEWDSEITEERPNEYIAWGALPDSRIINTGAVRFLPAADGKGTEVHVRIEYAPPGGVLGAAVAKLLNMMTARQVEGDLLRFKDVMETGEMPPDVTPAESNGHASPRAKAAQGKQGGRERDIVHEASEGSFPASDPPNYRGGMD